MSGGDPRRHPTTALAALAVALALAGCAQQPVTPGASASTALPAPAPAPAVSARPAAPGEETEAMRRARTRLDLASAYFADGQLTTALEEVRLALAANPDLPQALNLRGLIYGGMGEDQQAEASFRRAMQVAPADGDVLHNYGWFLCVRGRYPDAQTLFERALAIPQYRSTTRTLLTQGVCEARAGKLAEAELTLKRAYELDAGNPATAMNLAAVLYQRGEYERARFYVRRVNNQPELRSAETLWLAARVENRLGNAQGARELGNQLRSSYPNSREALAFERGSFDE